MENNFFNPSKLAMFSQEITEGLNKYFKDSFSEETDVQISSMIWIQIIS